MSPHPPLLPTRLRTAASGPAGERPQLQFRLELAEEHNPDGAVPRPVREALTSVLAERRSDQADLGTVMVYAVDVDAVSPDRLLRLLLQSEPHGKRAEDETEIKVTEGLGFFLFITRSRSLSEWAQPRFVDRTGLQSRLKENEFVVQTLVMYGLGRLVSMGSGTPEQDDPLFEFRQRVNRVLSRKDQVFPLGPALRTLYRDTQALRRIACAELGVAEDDIGPHLDGSTPGEDGDLTGAAAPVDASPPDEGDPDNLAALVANEIRDPERFVKSLRALYQFGRRRHVEAESEVRAAMPWRDKLGPVALRQTSEEILDRLVNAWTDDAATRTLKKIHTAIRAFDVLRDLSEWLAYGSHRWASHLEEMRILVIDEAFTDVPALDDLNPEQHRVETEIHERERGELRKKMKCIVDAFAGRARIGFEFISGPRVWEAVQKLLDGTGAEGHGEEIYVRRMFGAPGEPANNQAISVLDLLKYDIILVEVEFRNHHIGPRMVHKLTETLDRLGSHARTARRAGPGTGARKQPGGTAHPSVVVLSRSANFSYVQQCLNLGADAYVRKERMYELPMRVVRARITHRRPEPRGQKSNFRVLYSLFPEVIAALQSEDRTDIVLGTPDDLLDRDWIESLPKTDLHTHIGTCIDLETITALAFNTTGHLITRRSGNAQLSKGLDPLVERVCQVVILTAASWDPERASHWQGGLLEKALEHLAPHDGADASGEDQGGREYERVLKRLSSLHPGVNPFEVTSLLVAAFAVAERCGCTEVVASDATKPWQYLGDLSRWARENRHGETRYWPLEHLGAIALSLRTASNDLYGLSEGDRDLPADILYERAASAMGRVQRAAALISARMAEVAGDLRKAAAEWCPNPKRLDDLCNQLMASSDRKGGVTSFPGFPTLAALVRIPEETDPGERTLLHYLRGTALLGADHLQYPENLILAARSVAEQMSRENVIYCELRCETIGYTEASMGSIQATDLLCRALDVAAAWYAIKEHRPWTRFNVLLGAKRHKPEEKFRKIVSLAEHYLQSQSPERPMGEPAVPEWWRPCAVAGFDLSGDERVQVQEPGSLIRPLFLHSAPITIHAGEAASAESIWRAVYEYGARRIGHGLRLRENSRLLNYCISEGICMELCPTSNQYTNGFPHPVDRYCYESDWREYYPLRYYLERGLDVCINTDNRQLHTHGTLTDDFMCAARLVGGLTRWELLRIVKAGFKHAFLPKREIERMLRSVESRVYRIVTE